MHFVWKDNKINKKRPGVAHMQKEVFNSFLLNDNKILQISFLCR